MSGIGHLVSAERPTEQEKARAEFVEYLRNLALAIESRPFCARFHIQENIVDIPDYTGVAVDAMHAWPRTFIFQIGETENEVNGGMADALVMKAARSMTRGDR